jgi:hypothetical protein
MTMMTMELAPPLQRLVNERLDAIDRVLLMSGVPRDERQTTVSEVDSQIHEMLLQREGTELERGDLLAVLSKIDPPEAFLTDEIPAHALPMLAVSARKAPAAPLKPQPPVLAIASALAGLCGGISIIGVIVGYVSESEAIALLCGMMALLMGILATIGGVVSIFKLRDSSGQQFALPLAVFATLFLPLALLDISQLFVVELFEELGLFLSLGFSILLSNAIAIYAAWRFLASRLARPAV